MYLANTAVLSLYASGRTNGVVFNSGHEHTDVVPIYEGHALPHAIVSRDLGGCDVTLRLAELLSERTHSFSSPSELDTVRDLKEKLCYVACGGPEEASERAYEMPDGRTVVVGSERHRAAESLFLPVRSDVEAWKRLRLLWLGRGDHASALHALPKDIARLVQGHCLGEDRRPGFFWRLRNDGNWAAKVLHEAVLRCDPM